MKHSEDIQSARGHLNLVDILNRDTVHHIDEGFFILEEIAARQTPEPSMATNLGRTYMDRFCENVKGKLSQRSIPEPQLESLLKTVTALEASTFSEGSDVGTLKKAIASRLIDSYFQGYTKSEKKQAIGELMERIEKERTDGT